jgi:hypothetical protein
MTFCSLPLLTMCVAGVRNKIINKIAFGWAVEKGLIWYGGG